MRGVSSCLFLLSLVGCAGPVAAPPAVPTQPAPVAPVVEPPPPPPPPPPPTLAEISAKMAAALDAHTAATRAPSRESGSAWGSLASAGSDPADAIVAFKIVSTQGQFVKNGVSFALELHEGSLSTCMQKARDADLKGNLTVELAFDRDGTPTEPTVKSSTFKDKTLTECLRQVLRDVDPASHTPNPPDVQANQRATIRIDLELPQGF